MIRNFLFSFSFFSGIIFISIIFLPSLLLPQKIALFGGKLMGYWSGICLKIILSSSFKKKYIHRPGQNKKKKHKQKNKTNTHRHRHKQTNTQTHKQKQKTKTKTKTHKITINNQSIKKTIKKFTKKK